MYVGFISVPLSSSAQPAAHLTFVLRVRLFGSWKNAVQTKPGYSQERVFSSYMRAQRVL